MGAAASAESAEKSVTAEAGEGVMPFDGGFAPTVISKTKPTPIAFSISGDFQRSDGTHPPALTELIVEADKNLAVNVRGYPKCIHGGAIQVYPPPNCHPAIIGRGMVHIEIAFPEQVPIQLQSHAVVFNGGKAAGVTTFFIRADIRVPTPAAIFIPVKIEKIHKGRFGIEAVASIPKIAGGSGSVTAINFKIDRKFTYKGRRVSVLTLKCPDGKILTRARGIFADGTVTRGELIRTCKSTP
jgi:hypothetical protein